MYQTTDIDISYKVRAVRAILFDKDGTLFDFRGTWLPVFREAALRLCDGDVTVATELLRAAGYEAETDTFAPDGPIAAGTVVDVAQAWSGVLDRADHSLLAEEMDRYSLEIAPGHSVPVCDLPRLMNELRRAGYLLGVATSDSAGGARAALDRFGITELFSWVSGYDSGEGNKPDPAIIRRFASSVGVQAGEVAVVGDTFHDMRMGRSAGAALVVGVLTGAISRSILAPEADIVLESIADLPRLLGITPVAEDGRAP